MANSIRLAGIAQQSTVNGEGLRKVFFSQGCSHGCKNCFNPETWPFTGGQVFDIDVLVQQVLAEGYLNGVTLSGGDPFQQSEAFAILSTKLKQHKINIWAYTGYTFDELLKISKSNVHIKTMLNNLDVLIDGRFVEEQKDEHLKFRGSTNQRVIDVQKSLKDNKVHLYID
ncbi:MAG: anaerobic ribonucleoside-triphosphate reductase activating protein [Mycoplasmataceae bacterium]|nr:anaerobic ribonucleoside-triphosphate reductase activating protein [Mycoplasmataceae bacterium]